MPPPPALGPPAPASAPGLQVPAIFLLPSPRLPTCPPFCPPIVLSALPWLPTCLGSASCEAMTLASTCLENRSLACWILEVDSGRMPGLTCGQRGARSTPVNGGAPRGGAARGCCARRQGSGLHICRARHARHADLGAGRGGARAEPGARRAPNSPRTRCGRPQTGQQGCPGRGSAGLWGSSGGREKAGEGAMRGGSMSRGGAEPSRQGGPGAWRQRAQRARRALRGRPAVPLALCARGAAAAAQEGAKEGAAAEAQQGAEQRAAAGAGSPL